MTTKLSNMDRSILNMMFIVLSLRISDLEWAIRVGDVVSIILSFLIIVWILWAREK